VVIEKEYNVVTYSYGLGLSYFINAINLIKLSISRHQNGRLFDLTVYSDNLSSDSIEKSGVPFYYIQYCPSFTHRIMKNKFILPIEVGFNINKRIKEEELFYVVVKEHNYDVFFSTGLQYPILNDLLLGVNAKFNFALNNYLDPRFYIGSYKPIQFGLQVSIMYQFL
jgi:hypothetical protein